MERRHGALSARRTIIELVVSMVLFVSAGAGAAATLFALDRVRILSPSLPTDSPFLFHCLLTAVLGSWWAVAGWLSRRRAIGLGPTAWTSAVAALAAAAWVYENTYVAWTIPAPTTTFCFLHPLVADAASWELFLVPCVVSIVASVLSRRPPSLTASG